jgi:hypothetical protein
MADSSRDSHLTALIESLSKRTVSETDQLTAVLSSRCWPGGAADRTEPAALNWVRSWGPARLTAPSLDCGCSDGYCLTCN